MRSKRLITVLLAPSLFLMANSEPFEEPDIWGEGHPIPLDGRPNPYGLQGVKWETWQRQGRSHALNYPVEVTGLQIPSETLGKVFEPSLRHPLLALFGVLLKSTRSFASQDDVEAWLGLGPYPEKEGQGPYFVPFPNGRRPPVRMGSSLVESLASPGQKGLTYSCAACHVSQFFGKSVVGLTTRFPRSNDFFLAGKKAMAAIPESWIGPALGIPRADVPIVQQLARRVRSIDGVSPLKQGLDTSLAHVGLSLSRRMSDGYASFSSRFEKNPRENWLRHNRADSKPAVWWNLKYKNRWLSDGSVVSGNPIFTNILWNEIGRGTDLMELETWLEDNVQTVRELTAAVFATEPPRWLDVFPRASLDGDAAQRGESIYERLCSSCHGQVEKAWDNPKFAGVSLDSLSDEDFSRATETTILRYFSQTPVLDVGTDPRRAEGIKGLEQLNELEISKRFGTVIKVQQGYVPPPLLGVFSRYPYLHNNSVPSLCELLTPGAERRTRYLARPADNPKRDFDHGCVGYPEASEQELSQPRNRGLVFEAGADGLSNAGHDERIFAENGRSVLSDQDKRDLIEFLKTL